MVEVSPDGSERPLSATPLRPMTEAEISAAAATDPDARPMSAEDWQRARAYLKAIAGDPAAVQRALEVAAGGRC